MNERIRELLDEAQGSIDPMDEHANVWEKFAELIVKECALAVQDFVEHRIPASQYPERLKHHFGVDE